jgi:hypothetical protein
MKKALIAVNKCDLLKENDSTKLFEKKLKTSAHIQLPSFFIHIGLKQRVSKVLKWP